MGGTGLTNLLAAGWDTVRFANEEVHGFPFTVVNDPLFPFG